MVAADALIDGRLVRPFASVDAEVAYYFVGPEGRKDSAAAKALVDYLKGPKAAAVIKSYGYEL